MKLKYFTFGKNIFFKLLKYNYHYTYKRIRIYETLD